MEGVPGDPGVTFRAIQSLFQMVDERGPDAKYTFKASDAAPRCTFCVLSPRGSLSGCLVVWLSGCLVVWLQMSMLEVYMERVRDLLEGESSGSSSGKGKTAGMGSPSRPTLTSPTFKDDDGGKESLQIREVGNGQWVLTWIGDQSIPVEL